MFLYIFRISPFSLQIPLWHLFSVLLAPFPLDPASPCHPFGCLLIHFWSLLPLSCDHFGSLLPPTRARDLTKRSQTLSIVLSGSPAGPPDPSKANPGPPRTSKNLNYPYVFIGFYNFSVFAASVVLASILLPLGVLGRRFWLS